MKKFNDIEVIINDKRYTLSGYESEEYLQRVASYINNKHNEFRNKDAYKFLDSDLKNILIQINIADDYHKEKEKLKETEDENNEKSNEIFDLKHELIAAQTKLYSAEKEIDDLKSELNESQKKIVRLETELREADRKRRQ
ncbi:MAG: cell division protein ZapA [Clostridiales bacterium]|jgi:cell division protein ZapA|nr:cell division protein ZapA [Bacillota bacterium]NLK04153.1 cell division protein ZapA [Clostridiales bacterium]